MMEMAAPFLTHVNLEFAHLELLRLALPPTNATLPALATRPPANAPTPPNQMALLVMMEARAL